MADQSRSRLFLLGHFGLRLEGESPQAIQISSKKARALLAFLAMQPDRSGKREQIAALLWGERSDHNARQALRQCLSVLRGELGSPGGELLLSDANTIGLDADGVAIDAIEFLALAASSEAGDVSRAIALYSGEFLADLDFKSEAFEQWVSEQRARIELAAARIFETHARQMDLAGQGPEAMGAIDRLTVIDPLREDWQRLALEICARHRGRDAALARAKSFTALLTKELGVAPEPATAALITDIRRGRFGPHPSESIPGLDTVATAPNAPYGNATPIAAAAPFEWAPARPGWRELAARWGYRRALLYYSRRYGILIGCVGALTVDTILDAGVGPLWEKLFDATPALGEHATSVSSQSRSIGLAGTGLATTTVTPQHAALPLLVIAFREEGDADRVVTDGFTDELIGRLSRFSDIKVLSRETANMFLTRSSDVTRIGAELGAPYVVKTSVHRQADTMRINVELIDASNGVEVWSEQADAAAATLEGNRDDISTGLAARIHVKLGGLFAAYAERTAASRNGGVAPPAR